MIANPESQNQFGTLLTKKRAKNQKRTKEFRIEDYSYLDKRDSRMRFNNSQDPIYYIFDCIENRPVTTLAKEFVRDSFFEVASFVLKVVG